MRGRRALDRPGRRRSDRDGRAGEPGRGIRLRLRAPGRRERRRRARPVGGRLGRVGRQLRRAPPERCGLGRGPQPEGRYGGRLEERDRASRVARCRPVDRDQTHGPRVLARLQLVRVARVELPSADREHARVRGVVDQRVAEPPAPVVGDDEAGIGHALEGAGWQWRAHQRLDPRVLETHADHRGHPERISSGRRQGVDAGAEHGAQGQRDARHGALGQRHAPVVPGQRPVVERRPDRLGDEQRVAGGPLMDAARPIGVEGGPRDLRGELRGLGHGQAGQVDLLDPSLAHPGGPFDRAHRGEDHERQP